MTLISDDKPLLTIITEVRNGVDHIQQTINSVIHQDYENIEYIIVDGVSTDGTLDIIERNKEKISLIISEHDEGIYDAMNKGIRQAKGDLIGIIASNDWYNQNIFGEIINLHKLNKNAIIYGIAKLYDKEVFKAATAMSAESLDITMFPHATAFVPREVYEQYGMYDTSYKIAADYDAMIRFHRAGVPFVFCDKVISNVRLGGVSSTSLVGLEHENIKLKYGFITLLEENIIRKVLKKMFNNFVQWIREHF